MGVKFGMEEGTFGNMSPLRGEEPQNRPLSKLNTGRLALRTMLPVTNRQKTQRFWPPRRRVKSEAHQLGVVIEDLEHVLAPLKLLGL